MVSLRCALQELGDVMMVSAVILYDIKCLCASRAGLGPLLFKDAASLRWPELQAPAPSLEWRRRQPRHDGGPSRLR